MRVTTLPGESFFDRMIALVEGANRQKTPNEIALGILLAGFTLIFVLGVATFLPMAAFIGTRLEVTTLVALLVCLIPTTIGGLLPAIGIAGMAGLCAPRSSPNPVAPSKSQATLTPCCWTKPV